MKITWLILGLWIFTACAAIPDLQTESVDPKQEEPEKEEVEEERPILLHILYYLPSRVFDLFDIARFGLSSGPGIGIDLTLTEHFNLMAMTKKSVGAGLQTFRHLPIECCPLTLVNAGPLKPIEVPEGIVWYRSPYDIRLEIHIIQIGAHVAVEAREILDLLLGFFMIDILEDDL